MKENNQASGKLDQLTATTLLEDLQSTEIKTKKMQFKIYVAFLWH